MNFVKLDNGMYEGYALIKKIDKKTSSRGSLYLDMTLADSSGEINAKKWDYVDGFEADMIVKVRGDIDMYNGREQFKISQIRKINDSDNIKMSDLVENAPCDGEVLWQKLINKVDAFTDSDLKLIVGTLMNKYKDKFVYYPAALRMHHAVRGGLIYHTASIVKMAECASSVYENIDRELLISGALLHDIAKTWELDVNEAGAPKGYTTAGDLIGHLVKGAMEIEKIAEETGADKEKAVLLEHMVLSHHGVPEFGAAVRPMFLEAEVLSALDNLDATIFEFNHALSKVQPGSFTERQWALDNRKLYNHGRKDTQHKVNLDD